MIPSDRLSAEVPNGLKIQNLVEPNLADIIEDDSDYDSPDELFNNYLPYSRRLDKEADNLLSKIKASFGRCVLMRDIDPGCVYWSHMLSKYIELYGLRFSTDEIVEFIKLFYGLIVIPNLKSSCIDLFGNLFVTFLREKEIISPKLLQLEWNTLFELCNKVIAHQNKVFVLHRYSSTTVNTLHAVALVAKTYFAPRATEEILRELRPKIYPFDESVMRTTFKLYHWFLPVQLPQDHHKIGHELWLTEFMNIWNTCHRVVHWEGELMQLLASLASKNSGSVDWEPHMALMFTRFLRALKLPVDYKNPVTSSSSLQSKHIAEWIVAVFNYESAQAYFYKFVKTLESYFQPANQGPWTKSLEELFNKLVLNFTSRLSRERYKSESWEASVPEQCRLTEKDVDYFVERMLPIAMITVVDEANLRRNGIILQYLAMLRPNFVITELVKKLDLKVDEPIEPYRFGAVMDCMYLVRKPLIMGANYSADQKLSFSEGPRFVIPLMFSALEGIDPNDPNKAFKSITLITGFAQLVPLIDCSRSKLEKTPDVEKLCESTIRFKDLLLQFIEKALDLLVTGHIEFTKQEALGDHYGKTPEEITEKVLEEALDALLMQTDDEIFAAGLNRLNSFVMDPKKVLSFYGMRMVTMMCCVFRRYNSELTLGTFLPLFSGKIQDAIGTTKKVLNAANIDRDLRFSLELCAHLVEATRGDHLIPYTIGVIYMLKKAINLRNTKGSELACTTMRNLLESLTTVRPYRVGRNFNNPNYPYWEDWGKSADLENAKVKWYVPSDNGMYMAEKFIVLFFTPATMFLQEHANEKKKLTRIELQRSLRIVNAILEGLDNVLPMWQEPPIVIEGCSNCTFDIKPITGREREVRTANSRNVRGFLVNLLTTLQVTMLKDEVDDVQSLVLLTKIWENLSMNKTRFSHSVSVRLATIKHTRKIMRNKLTKDHAYTLKLFMDRIRAQHDLRRSHAVYAFTPSCKYIVKNLFFLCTTKSDKVKEKAQESLWALLNDHINAYQLLVPNILDALILDPVEAHKGVLYMINNNPKNSYLTKDDWQVLMKLLPTLVHILPSEYTYIDYELDYVALVLREHYHALVSFDLKIPDSCFAASSALWDTSGALSTVARPSDSEIIKGISIQESLLEENLKAYNNLLERLVDAMTEFGLHWWRRLLAMDFINSIIHPDHKVPPNVVSHLLQALISSSLAERRLARSGIMQCLRQHNVEYKMKKIKIPKHDKNELRPGRRNDNEWLQYNPKKFPCRVSEWEEPRFVHDPWMGYYNWSDEVFILAPTLLQPRIDRKPWSKMTDQEKKIDRFFKDRCNAQKFVEYLGFEEDSEHDKFNFYHFYLLKSLFRNFGYACMYKMLPHLKKLLMIKQETPQRFLIEIFCALVCGSKKWPYPMNANAWRKLIPMLDLALNNIVEETVDDWKLCFNLIQTNRDPAKIHWLIEFLLVDAKKVPLNGLVDCTKLSILKCVITNHVWRLTDVLNRLLPIIEKRLFDEPVENVRDSLASVMVAIFNSNLKLSDVEVVLTARNVQYYPSLEDFIDRIMVRLEPLSYDENVEDAEEYESSCTEAMKSLVSACAFIKKSYESSHVGLVPCFYRLYPLLIRFGRLDVVEQDKVTEICCETLGMLAKFWTEPKNVPVVLEAIDNAFASESCSTVVNNIQFFQVWLFHNMSTVISNENWIHTVHITIIKLLMDPRLAVREQAAQMLAGMIHCGILADEAALMEEFRNISECTPLPRRISWNDDEYNEALRKRHAAVLGMCAFIRAHPYDLPENIPTIFVDLSRHFHDPYPIPATIQFTFREFERTHRDTWLGLQVLANILSEEQLEILEDLTVPPNYIT